MQRKTFQKSILSLLIMALLVTGIPISSFAEDRDENSRENLMRQVEQKADKLLAMDDLSSRNRLTDYEIGIRYGKKLKDIRIRHGSAQSTS